MIGYLDLLLRLTIWFLLTTDLSPANIMIGMTIAFVLPHSRRVASPLRDWLDILGRIIIAIPIAYVETWEMIRHPHDQEEITREQVQTPRTPGLIFLEIFLITFTPKTIVLKYDEQGWYDVHRLRRGQNP